MEATLTKQLSLETSAVEQVEDVTELLAVDLILVGGGMANMSFY
jgi:hypothetical protein